MLQHTSPSLPQPTYNSFFSSAGALLDPISSIPSLTLPPPQDYMLNSGGLAIIQNAPSLLHGHGAPQQQFHHHVVKEESGNMIVFGSDQQSCSSSDGMHSQPQFGHGKELSFDGYFGYNNGSSIDHDHSRLLQLQDHHQAQVPVEYNYEEIKQLLLSSTTTGNNLHGHGQDGSMEGFGSQGKVPMM